MKKRLIIFISLVSLLLVCGCSGNKVVDNKENNNTTNNTNVISKNKANKMIGTYVLTGVEDNNKKKHKEEVEKVKNDYVIKIFDNNQGELYLNRKKHYITYDSQYLISTNKKKQIEKTKYKYSNNKIEVYYNGITYTFSKK